MLDKLKSEIRMASELKEESHSLQNTWCPNITGFVDDAFVFILIDLTNTC